MNWLNILRLPSFLGQLQILDGQGWMLVLALALGTAVVGGVTGLLAALGDLAHNVLAAAVGGLAIGADVLSGSALPVSAPQPAYGMPQATSLGSSGWLVSSWNREQRWPLSTGSTTLGSAPDNNLVLAGIAPCHAEIRLEANRHILAVLGNNQAWINDRLITGPNLFRDGFRVRLGAHELIFRTG